MRAVRAPNDRPRRRNHGKARSQAKKTKTRKMPAQMTRWRRKHRTRPRTKVMLRKKPKRRQGVPEAHEPRRHGRSRKIEAGELGLEGQAGGAEKYEVLVQHIYYLAISMIPRDAMARRFCWICTITYLGLSCSNICDILKETNQRAYRIFLYNWTCHPNTRKQQICK